VSVKSFEHRRAPLAPPEVFYPRVARSAAVSLSLIGGTLAAGTIGYRTLADLSWLEAFHQAAMLLSGMGPIAPDMKGTAAILFDSFYALFCGVMLLASTAVMFAPIIHRLLHRFHLEADEK